MTSFKHQLNEEEQSVSDSEEEIQNTSYKNANNSTTSIFTDNKLSSLIKNALKHPKIELQTKQSIDFVENHTTYLSEIMNTCSGRDKLLAIIQFSCSCYAECIDRNNQSDNTFNKDSFINAKQISNNLSYGRKVFRLLKFSDELSNIIKYNRNNNRTTLIQDTLFYSSGICSFFYYLLDNIIWLSLKKYKLLSKMKDFFSFTRCILEICKCIYEMNKDFNHEKKILKRLRSYERFLASDKDESYLLIQELIKLRRQMNFYMLDLITNVLRGIMLFKSLSLYGSIYLDPIFVEFCGVIGNFFALLKSIKKKYISKEQRKENIIKSKISSKFINCSYSNELFQNYLGNGYIRHPKFTSFNHTKFGAPIAKIASTRESSSSLNST